MFALRLHPGDIELAPRSECAQLLSRARYKATTEVLRARIYTSYIDSVRFLWDSAKSERNLVDRGFDFEFASLVFAGPTLERIDTRQDYGEVRRIALGIADGVPLTVVFTDRAEAGEVVRRIISARVSSRRERQAYRKVFPT